MAIAKTGNATWRRFSCRFSVIGVQPATGSSLSFTERMKTKMVAVRNGGDDSINEVTPLLMRSNLPSRTCAAYAPSGIAMRRAKTSASTESSRLTGMRARISCATGSFVRKERPRSPCSASPTHST
jgi:hypothetical protein